MKNEMSSVLRRLDNDLTAAPLQARRAVSPVLQLFSARNTRKLRIKAPSRFAPGLTLNDRKLNAARHAAELVVWDATGGDFLVSIKKKS